MSGNRPPGGNAECALGAAWNGVQTIERSCSRVVLIAEVDERRLAFRLTAAGLVSLHERGERASEAGSRRRSRENGGGLPPMPSESGQREHTSMEGVLVGGRRCL